ESFGQFNVGASLGGGVITLSPISQGSLNTSIFLDFQLKESYSARLNFIYNADYEAFLPNKTVAYAPFVKGVTLKAIINPSLSETFYLEEGLGLSALNERVFSDHNDWDFGVVFSLAIARPIYENFDLAAGAEYNLTMTGTAVKYFSLFLQGKYSF
ncbi:MAG: hypothetical protein Q8903_03830, partial [Bacteroidota bacterium]|nr:hypothetical protein [Bacteroidota bacterium]